MYRAPFYQLNVNQKINAKHNCLKGLFNYQCSPTLFGSSNCNYLNNSVMRLFFFNSSQFDNLKL